MFRRNCCPSTAENSSVYWKALPLRAGHYRLDIVVKDVNGDRVGIWSRSLTVPEFIDDDWRPLRLIVADQMEPVPTKDIGTGNFVIGTTKVRPRVAPADGKPVVFKTQHQKMNFWMQVYNLTVDEKTHKPSATFEYNVINHRHQQGRCPQDRIHRHHGEYRRSSDPAEVDFGRESSARYLPDSDQGERQHLQADLGSVGDFCRRVTLE